MRKPDYILKLTDSMGCVIRYWLVGESTDAATIGMCVVRTIEEARDKEEEA